MGRKLIGEGAKKRYESKIKNQNIKFNERNQIIYNGMCEYCNSIGISKNQYVINLIERDLFDKGLL